jgi:hypothetical protein
MFGVSKHGTSISIFEESIEPPETPGMASLRLNYFKNDTQNPIRFPSANNSQLWPDFYTPPFAPAEMAHRSNRILR